MGKITDELNKVREKFVDLKANNKLDPAIKKVVQELEVLLHSKDVHAAINQLEAVANTDLKALENSGKLDIIKTAVVSDLDAAAEVFANATEAVGDKAIAALVVLAQAGVNSSTVLSQAEKDFINNSLLQLGASKFESLFNSEVTTLETKTEQVIVKIADKVEAVVKQDITAVCTKLDAATDSQPSVTLPTETNVAESTPLPLTGLDTTETTHA